MRQTRHAGAVSASPNAGCFVCIVVIAVGLSELPIRHTAFELSKVALMLRRVGGSLSQRNAPHGSLYCRLRHFAFLRLNCGGPHNSVSLRDLA